MARVWHETRESIALDTRDRRVRLATTRYEESSTIYMSILCRSPLTARIVDVTRPSTAAAYVHVVDYYPLRSSKVP